jgi:NAD(P)-dependent dehydrogenase (short-subunit alcohol dehydrogenase family)
MKDFAGKVAVITGGAEGIGRAFADKAASLGMKLVLADINGDKLEQTAQQLCEQFSVEVVTQIADVSKAEAVQALADRAWAAFGRVHLLFNNAGVAFGGNAWDTTKAQWDWVLGVNLYGVIYGVQSFVPRMIADGEEGHIINTASAAGLISQPSMSAYNVSKHGVVTLSEGLYHDLSLRKANISVSVLCPAWVKTRIADFQRYNDEKTPASTEGLDKVARQTARTIENAVENGMSPVQVAEATFAAIHDNHFYILTHDPVKIAVQLRMKDIVEGHQPRLLPFN